MYNVHITRWVEYNIMYFSYIGFYFVHFKLKPLNSTIQFGFCRNHNEINK